MTLGTATLILAVLIVVGAYSVEKGLRQIIEKRFDDIEKRFNDQETMLDDIKTELENLQGTLSEMEWRLLTPAQKERRRYERARPLTIADVRKWESGEEVRLISCSYIYPHEDPLIDRIDYRHDRIAEDEPTEWGVKVCGFRMEDLLGKEWEPYEFYANEEESSTSSAGGTIRRLFG